MIWNIFKKDLKTLWLLVLGVTAAQFLSEWLAFEHVWSAFGQGDRIKPFFIPPLVTLAGIAVLIVISVQQDAVADTRQDWRSRPIKGTHLLLAKLLFVLATVHAPMLAANLTSAMASGFPFDQSLAVALERNAVVLVFLSLPVMALAAQTRNMLQVLLVALLVTLVGVGGSMLIDRLELPAATYRSTPQGLQVELMILVLLGTACVLVVQYVWQKTAWTWVLMALLVAVLPFAQLPSKPVTAAMRWLSPDSGPAAPISLAFAPTEKRLIRAPDMGGNNSPLVFLEMPVHIAGMPAHSRLLVDNAELRLIDASGNTVHQTRTAQHREIDAADPVLFESLFLPREMYERIRQQPLRAELRYSMLLLQTIGPHLFTASDQKTMLPGIGQCQTVTDTQQRGTFNRMFVRCVQLGPEPTCFNARQENSNSKFNCSMGTTGARQIRLIAGIFDTFERPLLLLPSTDERSSPAAARIVSTAQRVDEYLTSTLVIPQVRLADLEADSARLEPPGPQADQAGASVMDQLVEVDFTLSYKDRKRSASTGSGGVSLAGGRHLPKVPNVFTANGEITATLQVLPPESDEIIAKLWFDAPAAGNVAGPKVLLATAALKTRFGTPVTLILAQPKESLPWEGRWKARFVVEPPPSRAAHP